MDETGNCGIGHRWMVWGCWWSLVEVLVLVLAGVVMAGDVTEAAHGGGEPQSSPWWWSFSWSSWWRWRKWWAISVVAKAAKAVVGDGG